MGGGAVFFPGQAESQQMSLETLRAQNRLIEEPGAPEKDA